MLPVPVGVLEQVPVLQDALVGATVGALLGETVTSYRERRRPGARTANVTLRWTWAGTVFALLVHTILA
jgi:hypothetical protein